MHTPAHAQQMRSEFITGLVNAHALEKEAMVLMERQINRLEHYPELPSACASTSRRRIARKIAWMSCSTVRRRPLGLQGHDDAARRECRCRRPCQGR